MKEFAKKNYQYVIYMSFLWIIGLFFFFFVGEQGYILEKDSGAFLGDNITYQYIVYPRFLELCRKAFGEMQYLQWVSNIQGFIALCVSLVTTEFFRKNYGLNYVMSGLVFICTFGPYAYSLPQYVSSHSILTEGLAFPLFYLWMLCALQIYLKKKKAWFLPLFIVTLIMAYTRTQLMLFFVAYFLIVMERIVSYVYKKIPADKRKMFVRICLLCGGIGIILGGKVFLLFVEHNIYPQMTDAVAGRVFCAAEESDVELFEGRNRDLFLGIYDEIERMKSRQDYFRTGIRQWEDIANATNENTKMLAEIIRPYYPEIEMRELNDVKGKMAYEMLLKHWDDYLAMTGSLLIQSLVVSVFVHPEQVYLLGYIVAFFIYMIGIGSIIWSKRKYHVDNRYIIPIALTFSVILSISMLTNILFVGLQRYVVYPFGCFYISLIVLYSGIKTKSQKNDFHPSLAFKC